MLCLILRHLDLFVTYFKFRNLADKTKSPRKKEMSEDKAQSQIELMFYPNIMFRLCQMQMYLS